MKRVFKVSVVYRDEDVVYILNDDAEPSPFFYAKFEDLLKEINRKYGVYKIYELKGVRGLSLLAETGQDDWLGSVDEIRNEINRREKQKETDWNLFIRRSRR